MFSTVRAVIVSPTAKRLHTSVVVRAPKRSSKSSKRAQGDSTRATRRHESHRAHVVLGTRPGEERKWRECDLYRTLIHLEDLAPESAPSEPDPESVIAHTYGTLTLPKHLGFGIGERERRMLFEDLPVLSAQVRESADLFRFGRRALYMDKLASRYEEREKFERHKAGMLATLMDLRNANAGGINFANRKRIVLAFSGTENAFDTGRPEVQGSLRTLLSFVPLAQRMECFSRYLDHADTKPLRPSTKVHQRHRQPPQSAHASAPACKSAQVSQTPRPSEVRYTSPASSVGTGERRRGARRIDIQQYNFWDSKFQSIGSASAKQHE
jgi:small subunit ribosomal protein S15